MIKQHFRRGVVAAVIAWTLGIMPAAAIAQQTRISMPKNRYNVRDDVRLGNQASGEVERQFPVLNDAVTTQFVGDVGASLVAAIPAEFRHPEFDYRFKVVNASDINAFALPGGPMYVNRGMIQAARNEGEMAGVMAHEISHVALRHATAQATKQGNWKNQLGMLGMILGGAVVGGQAGAQLGMLGAQAWMTKYSREYETQADALGAQIMARAGYDPRDLANMFRTIAQQERGGGPDWLSSHPNPENRYARINQEAEYLNVAQNPRKMTREFERVKSRLAGMPRARTMEQLQREYERTGGRNPASGGRYTGSVEYPSARTRVYSSGGWITMRVPANWREFSTGSQVTFAPEGAYGEQGITHGAMAGIVSSNARDAYGATEEYVNELLQSNRYLRRQDGLTRTTVSGRQGYRTTLSGRSDVTGKTEVVTIYAVMLRSGELFYIATVSPQDDAYRYDNAFRNLVSSVRLSG